MTTEAPPTSPNGAPPAASRRAYLRVGLPSVYRERSRSEPEGAGLRHAAQPPSEEPFAVRFVEALEQVLDPIVAMLDLLPAHLDVAIAPPDFVEMLGDWLGLELDAGLESDPARLLAAHRALVARANEITARRGTRAGMELLLEHAFEGVPLTVRETGAVTTSADPYLPQPAVDPCVTVTHPSDLRPNRRAALRRVLEDVKPAGVRLELRAADGEEGRP